MASDSLREVGQYIKKTNKQANLSLKRNFSKLPVRDRARDVISDIAPFRMDIQTDESAVTIDINFDKPPPADCAAECYATACQSFNLTVGGHSITVGNPYEEGTMRVYIGDSPLENVQWYEENPGAGQVYVQVQNSSAIVVTCYTYIIC